MIITVTMNPAVDKTIEINRLVHGGLNRISHVELDAGGKGINVSRTVRELGGVTVATGFVGGSAGAVIERELKALGIQTDFVHVGGETRTNTKVCEADGTLTELNEQGPEIAPQELEELLARLENYAGVGVLFVLSGSIPRGIDTDIYARIIRLVHGKGAQVLLDADGELFSRALAAAPDLIKPNRMELEQYAGMAGETPQGGRPAAGDSVGGDCDRPDREKTGRCTEAPDGASCSRRPGTADLDPALTEAARRLRRDGISTVAVSLGPDGALFFGTDGVGEAYELYCPGLPVQVRSTVGAGDAMVAALALAWDRGLPPEEMIRTCMAVSAGAVTTSGTKPPARKLVEELKARVEVQVI